MSSLGSLKIMPTRAYSPTFALNEEQRAAVEHGDGPLLVIAGAGTGKTRVITERIRNLLESDAELAGENILGLTFTDKAAGEMKYRVTKSVGERAEGVWLGTFHGFCLHKILCVTDSEVRSIDDVDHWILLRRNIGELQLEQFRRLAEPGEFLSDFVAFFSRCQDELVSCDDYQRYVDGLRRNYEGRKKQLEPDAQRLEEDELARQEELARAYRVSERLLRENNLITFGAQLMQAVELLRSDGALLEQLREQYRYILVDEFQDTNIAQLELLYLLAGDRRNIVAVGDDDQAIYRFRGASFGSFTIFLKRFCGVGDSKLAVGRNKHLVSLTQNYRSTQRILRVAGEVISANEKSPLLPPKRLKTDNPDGEKIRVAEFGTPGGRSALGCVRNRAAARAGESLAQFCGAVSQAHASRQIARSAAAKRHSVRHSQRFSILSSTIVRDLLAYLRLIAVPSDNVACARVLAAPYWGLEPRDLVRFAERAEKNRRRPLSEELDAVQGELPFARVGTHFPELVSMLNGLRQTARRVTTSELLDELIRSLEAGAVALGRGSFLSGASRGIREGVGAAKRGNEAARFHRVSRFFRGGERRYLPGGRTVGRCGAADDGAFGQGARIPARFYPAPEQARLPFRDAAGDVRISSRADEGRKTGRRFSDSGGAAAFLCGTHAGAAAADAFDDRQQI